MQAGETRERNRGATRATNPFGIILCILPNGFVFHVLPPAKFTERGRHVPGKPDSVVMPSLIVPPAGWSGRGRG